MTNGEILKKSKKIELAVEGKYTNIIIWLEDKGRYDGIYIRLDKGKQYSVPLYNNIKYLETDNALNNKNLIKLSEMGFPIDLSKLDEVCELIKNFKKRNCIEW